MLKKKDMLEMSDDKLREISLRKNIKGNATGEAFLAQSILWERNGEQFYYDDEREDHYDN